jgi:hypothetical protein
MARRSTHEPGEQRPRMPWWAHLLGRAAFRLRWALTPVAVAVAVPPAGWAAALLDLAGWQWVAGPAAVAVFAVALWVRFSLDDLYERVYGAAAAVVCLGYAAAIAAAPGTISLYGAWFLFLAPLGGLPWWFGKRFRSLAGFDRVARKFAATRLGEEGARLVEHSRTKAGEVLKVRLPRRMAASAVKAEDIAHDYDVDPATVIAARDKGGSRNVTIKLLASEVFARGPVPHPALAAGALAEGGAWAPGARSILDPIPFGPDPDDTEVGIRLWTEDGDAQHWALFGMTGGGKSGSLSNILAGVAACRDAVLIVSDTPKKGATAAPYVDVIDWLAIHAENTKAQLRSLYALSEWRCAQLGPRGWDKWQVSQADPGVVAVIEELAALLIAFPEIADQIEQAALLFRQAGISLVYVSQGGDFDSIPIAVRRQTRGMLVHRMEHREMRTIMPKAAALIDPSAFEKPGLVYVNDGGGIDDSVDSLTPVKAYALYKPADKRTVAAAYREHRPRLDSGSTRAMGEAYARRPADPFEVPAEPVAPAGHDASRTPADTTGRAEVAGRVADAQAAADQLDDAPPLIGGPLDRAVAAVPAEPVVESAEDESLSARVLDVLGKAGELGARLGEIADAVRSSGEDVPTSKRTVGRRLTALRDLGRVRASGHGSATRWHAVESVEVG